MVVSENNGSVNSVLGRFRGVCKSHNLRKLDMSKSFLLVTDDPRSPAFSTVGHTSQDDLGDFQSGFTEASYVYVRHRETNNVNGCYPPYPTFLTGADMLFEMLFERASRELAWCCLFSVSVEGFYTLLRE